MACPRQTRLGRGWFRDGVAGGASTMTQHSMPCDCDQCFDGSTIIATKNHTDSHGSQVPPATLAALTQITLDDLVSSFGWQNRPLLASLSRRLFSRAAQTFAHHMTEFDTAVGRHGLAQASRLALHNYVSNVRVFHRERLPAHAFLALSNHPGMTDTLLLFSALNRPDLRIIAAPRPFLAALPYTSEQLHYLTDDASSQAALIRKLSTHLRAGGAALSFPAGKIEPDPDVRDGAAESLKSWASSASLFIRLAPEAAIVPVLVRGVVWSKAAHGLMTGLNDTKRDEERVAAALQLLAHTMLKVRAVSARVQFGRPIYAKALGTTNAQAIHEAVLTEMAHLIRNPPEGEGEPLQ